MSLELRRTSLSQPGQSPLPLKSDVCDVSQPNIDLGQEEIFSRGRKQAENGQLEEAVSSFSVILVPAASEEQQEAPLQQAALYERAEAQFRLDASLQQIPSDSDNIGLLSDLPHHAVLKALVLTQSSRCTEALKLLREMMLKFPYNSSLDALFLNLSLMMRAQGRQRLVLASSPVSRAVSAAVSPASPLSPIGTLSSHHAQQGQYDAMADAEESFAKGDVTAALVHACAAVVASQPVSETAKNLLARIAQQELNQASKRLYSYVRKPQLEELVPFSAAKYAASQGDGFEQQLDRRRLNSRLANFQSQETRSLWSSIIEISEAARLELFTFALRALVLLQGRHQKQYQQLSDRLCLILRIDHITKVDILVQIHAKGLPALAQRIAKVRLSALEHGFSAERFGDSKTEVESSFLPIVGKSIFDSIVTSAYDAGYHQEWYRQFKALVEQTYFGAIFSLRDAAELLRTIGSLYGFGDNISYILLLEKTLLCAQEFPRHLVPAYEVALLLAQQQQLQQMHPASGQDQLLGNCAQHAQAILSKLLVSLVLHENDQLLCTAIKLSMVISALYGDMNTGDLTNVRVQEASQQVYAYLKGESSGGPSSPTILVRLAAKLTSVFQALASSSQTRPILNIDDVFAVSLWRLFEQDVCTSSLTALLQMPSAQQIPDDTFALPSALKECTSAAATFVCDALGLYDYVISLAEKAASYWVDHQCGTILQYCQRSAAALLASKGSDFPISMIQQQIEAIIRFMTDNFTFGSNVHKLYESLLLGIRTACLEGFMSIVQQHIPEDNATLCNILTALFDCRRAVGSTRECLVSALDSAPLAEHMQSTLQEIDDQFDSLGDRILDGFVTTLKPLLRAAVRCHDMHDLCMVLDLIVKQLVASMPLALCKTLLNRLLIAVEFEIRGLLLEPEMALQPINDEHANWLSHTLLPQLATNFISVGIDAHEHFSLCRRIITCESLDSGALIEELRLVVASGDVVLAQYIFGILYRRNDGGIASKFVAEELRRKEAFDIETKELKISIFEQRNAHERMAEQVQQLQHSTQEQSKLFDRYKALHDLNKRRKHVRRAIFSMNNMLDEPDLALQRRQAELYQLRTHLLVREISVLEGQCFLTTRGVTTPENSDIVDYVLFLSANPGLLARFSQGYSKDAGFNSLSAARLTLQSRRRR